MRTLPAGRRKPKTKNLKPLTGIIKNIMIIDRETKLIIKRALSEDIGREDVTTLFTIPYHFKAKAVILAKEKGVLCGIDIARAVFKERSSNILFKALKKDGASFDKNEHIAYVSGEARTILAAERVSLNFLSMLSGISTVTKKFVDNIKGTHAKILDTRKTTPTLRNLEKYAVKMGGGVNHRRALEEAILVKDNHLRAGKFIQGNKVNKERIGKCLAYLHKIPNVKLEIEVETLEEFENVIKHRPDVVMLDNFGVSNMKEAVKYRNKYFPRVKLEASGGVRLENVASIAKTGVDFISIGSLTHSPKAVDFSLEILDT